ncbi:uncharacterized protein METZ01_LOCUS450275, partial [marine metagenome]
YRQKLTVGSWTVMTAIYYAAMISHWGLIRILPRALDIERLSGIILWRLKGFWKVFVTYFIPVNEDGCTG